MTACSARRHRVGGALFVASLAGLWLAALTGCGAPDDPSGPLVAAATLPALPSPLEGQPARRTPAEPAASDAALEPSVVDELRERGLFHHGLGDADATLEHLVPVYRFDPGDDRVALAVAEASSWKNDVKTALGIVASLRAPEAPAAIAVLGRALEQAGRLDEARALYERALQRQDPPWSLLERLGQVLSWQRQFDAAVAAYERVASSGAAPPELRRRCRVRIAEITSWEGHLERALEQLGAVLSEAPEQIDALLLQGQIHEWRGEFVRAKQSYSRILGVDAGQAEARARLGKLLWVEAP